MQQQRFPTNTGAPALQRMGSINNRMPTPNAVQKRTVPPVPVQQSGPKPPVIQSMIKPQQYVNDTKSSTVDLCELDDLENSITAAKIHKTPPEPPPPSIPSQNVGSTQYIIQSQPNMQMCQKPNYQNQRLANSQMQQPYLHNQSLGDSSCKMVALRNGGNMPLTEYKRVHDGQYVLPQQQLQNLNQCPPGQAIIRGNGMRGRGSIRGTGQLARGSYAKKPYRLTGGNQQLQQQNHINPSHIIETEKARESAKMLVVLQSGEQRLITFTLPKESCTVQELLEQVGVPFSGKSLF